MKKGNNLIKFLIIAIIIALFVLIIYPRLNKKIDLEFNINISQMDVKIDESIPIDYSINKDLTIEWESDNTSVVTINNGVIKGIGLGNTLVKAKVIDGDNIVIKSCYVSTYYGEKNSLLSDIVVPKGELYLTKNSTYKLPIEYNPTNAYITSIDYVIDDTNILDFDGNIYAKNIGVTNISVIVNKKISKIITVHVIDKNIEPVFASPINNIILNQESVSIRPNVTVKLDFNIEPIDAFVESIRWESNDSSVATVLDGEVTGKSPGNTIVKLIINENIIKEINVEVIVPVTGISLKSDAKLLLRVGMQSSIKVDVNPTNATNKKLEYISSNSSVIRVDENGIITALSAGNGVVTIKSIDGGFSTMVNVTVNPQNGVINGDGGIYGYSSSFDQVPVRADVNFFKNLASGGKGTLSGDVYTYTDAKHTYKYTISKSILNVEKRGILMRIYYPQGVDLSTVNTFTFFGGAGERNMGSYFSVLDRDREQMKSSGIIILISANSSYDAQDGIYSTDFVKSLVNQKAGVKNAVAGYSMGGPSAGEAANTSYYDRLIIFDSYFDNVQNRTNLMNKEIIFYSPIGDSMLHKTTPALDKMMNYPYNNVTIITNNNDLIKRYSSKFLVVNPGEKLGRGHGYNNITNAKLFSYACS